MEINVKRSDCSGPEWIALLSMLSGGPIARDTDLRNVPISKLLQFFSEHYKSLTTDELNTLIADLNAELYSRRNIKPEDDPSAGVAQAALNCDAGDLIERHIRENDLPASLVAPQAAAAMDETMNFADIFIKAASGGTSADAAMMTQGVQQLDKNNLPWDARIHAASKAVNADGTWRQRRGVDRELVATVEAELRQVMGLKLPDDTHGSPELDADAAKLAAMGADPGPTVGQVAGIIPPPPPVATPPAPPVTAAEPTTFPELVAFISAQKVAGKLTQDQVTAALKEISIEGPLPVINARLDLIPVLVARLRAVMGA